MQGTIVLVNPIRQRRYTLHCKDYRAARTRIRRWARQFGRTAHTIAVPIGPKYAARFASTTIPDSDGIGYWHASSWTRS